MEGHETSCGLAVLAGQQVAGFIGGMLLLATKNVIVLGLLIAAMYGVVQLALSGLSALVSWSVSMSGVTSGIMSLSRNREGPLWVAVNALALSDFLQMGRDIFATWLACWAVFRGLQHTAIIRRFGILRGFWQ